MNTSPATSHIIESALANIDHDLHGSRHMPGAMYSSPEVYGVERDQIFMRNWLCVGREEELPAPGDYFAARVMGEPY